MIKFLQFIFILLISANIFPQQADKVIEISRSKGFFPQNFSINSGDKIIFRSVEGNHIITFRDAEFTWESSINKTKPETSIILDQTGTLQFYCKNHNDEFGTVTINKILNVELKTFKAEYLNFQILIQWQTIFEKNNAGFDLERKREFENIWKVVASIPAENNLHSTADYEYFDEDIIENEKYFYRLKQKNTNGEVNYFREIEVSTSGKGNYRLFQNYPNPFNPVTKISYSIPNSGFVSLKVYNALGNEVRTLLNEEQPSGLHEMYFDGSELPTGVYYLQLTSNGFKQIIKMILLR